MFRDGEVQSILNAVKERLIPNLSDEILNWRWNFDSNDDNPEGYFDRFVEAISAYSDALSDDQDVVAKVDDAIREVREVVAELESEQRSYEYDDDYSYSGASSISAAPSTRSIFDDVDA